MKDLGIQHLCVQPSNKQQAVMVALRLACPEQEAQSCKHIRHHAQSYQENPSKILNIQFNRPFKQTTNKQKTSEVKAKDTAPRSSQKAKSPKRTISPKVTPSSKKLVFPQSKRCCSVWRGGKNLGFRLLFR